MTARLAGALQPHQQRLCKTLTPCTPLTPGTPSPPTHTHIPQGRLPIRVELQGLTAADFHRILTEPDNNMIRQQQELLGTEGVRLTFTDGAVRAAASLAEQVRGRQGRVRRGRGKTEGRKGIGLGSGSLP